jgi:hypothetical protein
MSATLLLGTGDLRPETLAELMEIANDTPTCLDKEVDDMERQLFALRNGHSEAKKDDATRELVYLREILKSKETLVESLENEVTEKDAIIKELIAGDKEEDHRTLIKIQALEKSVLRKSYMIDNLKNDAGMSKERTDFLYQQLQEERQSKEHYTELQKLKEEHRVIADKAGKYEIETRNAKHELQQATNIYSSQMQLMTDRLNGAEHQLVRMANKLRNGAVLVEPLKHKNFQTDAKKLGDNINPCDECFKHGYDCDNKVVCDSCHHNGTVCKRWQCAGVAIDNRCFSIPCYLTHTYNGFLNTVRKRPSGW